jgi:hypothetical protein
MSMPNDWLWPKPSLLAQKNSPLGGRQPGRNGSRPVQMPQFCGPMPSNSMPRFKPSSGRFDKRKFALRWTELCLRDWRTWIVSSIRTRTGKSPQSTTREVANMRGGEPTRRRPLARRTAGGSHPRFGKKLHSNGGVIDEATFGQIPICSKNRRDQFIPAPSKLRFNRLQIAILFGARALKFSVFGSRLANSTNQLSFASRRGECLLTPRASASARNCRGG